MQINTTKPIKIRASMLSGYPDCPRRGAANQYPVIIKSAGYTVKKLPNSIGTYVGNGLHAAVNYQANSYINTGLYGKINDSIEVGICKLTDDISAGVYYDQITESKNTAEQQVVRAVKSFSVEVAPNIKPARAEQRRTAHLGGNFEFTGQPDLITTDPFLDDIKGGARSRPHHAQLGGYIQLEKTFEPGFKPAGVRLWHLPRVSLKKVYPGAQKIEYPIDLCVKSAWSVIQRIIWDVNKFLATGDPWSFLANPCSMLCSEKYCPAYGTDFCEVHN